MEKLQWCYKCLKNKDKSLFTDGIKKCLECRDKSKSGSIKRSAYNAEYYQKHIEVLRPKHREWSEAHKKPSQPRKPRTRKPIPVEKLCPDCGITKPVSEFNISLGYVKWVCKRCELIRAKTYQRAHTKEKADYQRKYQALNREKISLQKRKRYHEMHPEAKVRKPY